MKIWQAGLFSCESVISTARLDVANAPTAKDGCTSPSINNLPSGSGCCRRSFRRNVRRKASGSRQLEDRRHPVSRPYRSPSQCTDRRLHHLPRRFTVHKRGLLRPDHARVSAYRDPDWWDLHSRFTMPEWPVPRRKRLPNLRTKAYIPASSDIHTQTNLHAQTNIHT
jgi:hypothetical protein